MNAAWYQYLFVFLAGGFIINGIPHFVKGLTGQQFPTPFAKPPGVGLSSPTLNIVWATSNFLLSALFFFLADITSDSLWLLLSGFTGCMCMAFYLASYFGKLNLP